MAPDMDDANYELVTVNSSINFPMQYDESKSIDVETNDKAFAIKDKNINTNSSCLL